MMAPLLLKDLSFIDDGERIEFPAVTPVEVVSPEMALADDPHRLGLVLGALAERQRRFRPGVAVRLGDRIRVVSARVIGSTTTGTEATGGDPEGRGRCRGPPPRRVLGKGAAADCGHITVRPAYEVDTNDHFHHHSLIEGNQPMPMPQKTIFRTRDEIARALDMTVRNFAYLLGAGCPGVPGCYILEDVEAWLARRAELRKRNRHRRRSGGGLSPR